MTDPNRQADALLTEHFQYTPLSLIDDIINAVNTIIFQAMEALENGLLQIPPRSLGFGRDQTSTTQSIPDMNDNGSVEYPEAAAEIENGVHQLETLLESTVDKAFDYFEIWTLRNVLTIPDNLTPWMRLGHYENLQLPLPQNAPTPESVLALRRKLLETKKLNHTLRSTHTRNAAIIGQLNAIISSPPTPTDSKNNQSLSFLTTSTDPSTQSLQLSVLHPSKALTTNSQFTTSQLPALKGLVAQLRPKVRELREGKGVRGNVDSEGRREERRRYIEGGVRKVLGRSGAVEGEEVGGERRGREEVEGLEGVVGGLGREYEI